MNLVPGHTGLPAQPVLHVLPVQPVQPAKPGGPAGAWQGPGPYGLWLLGSRPVATQAAARWAGKWLR